ncbi:hypothetical protein DVK44_14355 [Streptomyces paludis]|uniref:Uncharacterized protein n=1 Tax=Streptomyces paludis TaxID=2282738 RepID=A0A345HPS3_9ACTN|nr:hypothetical protein DVK44_14355 [Streptomyces paludis]
MVLPAPRVRVVCRVFRAACSVSRVAVCRVFRADVRAPGPLLCRDFGLPLFRPGSSRTTGPTR